MRVSRDTFLISIMLLFVMSISAMISYGGILAIGITPIVALYGHYECKNKKNGITIPLICLIILIFQNFCIGIGAHLTSNTLGISWITQVSFIFIATEFICEFLKKKLELDELDKLFILFIFILFISSLRGVASIESELIYLRNLVTFYFAYKVGRVYLVTEEQKRRFIRISVKLVIAVIVIGIILRSCGTSVWTSLGVYEVYQAKKSGLGSNGLPERFYTVLVNRPFLRMASLYYEPVNLAYLMVFGIVACTKEKNRRNKYINTGIIIIGLLLTFGKGGYLLFGFLIGTQALYFLIKKVGIETKQAYRISVFTVLIGCIGVGIIYYSIGAGGFAMAHYMGIIGTFKSVIANPLGYGLGVGGNMGAAFGSETDWLSSGGETAIMGFAYQIGVPGVIVMIIILVTMSKHTAIENNNVMIKSLSIGLVLAGMFQENTFTPQCVVPLMILQGMYCDLKVASKKDRGSVNEKMGDNFSRLEERTY